MIIGGTHWLLALGIALSIHLAGMLWLSFPSPTRQQVADRTSESVVVTLGRHALRAATDAETLSPPDSAAVEAAAAAAARRPETVGPASGPQVAEAKPVPAAVETAGTAQPEAAGETAAPEPAAEDVVKPRSAPSESVVAREASEPSVQTVDVQADVQEAPQRAASDTDAVATTVQPPTPAEPGPTVDAEGIAAPTAFAANAPVPEPAAPSAPSASAPVDAARTVEADQADPTRQIESVEVAGADEPDVEATVARQPPPDTGASVEAVSTVQAEETDPARQVESVEVAATEQPEVEVAAARQPSSEVEGASQPDVREAEVPEVIDLQELQESGGGSGVAARYAGVLKGWLQKNMHYPRAARLAGQEGEVVVRFIIDRDGNVQSIELESRSGHPLLDREAREMIERGDPFPHMPEDMPGGKLEVRVPVNFHVRDDTMTKEIPPIYLE